MVIDRRRLREVTSNRINDPRSEAEATGPLDPDEYEIYIPKGTVHLHVD